MATSSTLHSFPLHRLAIALIAGGLALHATAQSTAPAAADFPTSTSPTSPALPSVVVKGSADAPVMVGGFGDTPIAKLPCRRASSALSASPTAVSSAWPDSP